MENNDIENGVQIVAEADATVPVSQKVTTPYLTKYERARIRYACSSAEVRHLGLELILA